MINSIAITSKKIVINIDETCTPTVPVSQSLNQEHRPKCLLMTNPGISSFSQEYESAYESECEPNLGLKRLEFSSPGFSQTHTQRQDLFVGLHPSATHLMR